MNYLAINKCGQTIPVYTYANGLNKIGSIYPNERFSYTYSANYSLDREITFRNSAGSFVHGWAMVPAGVDADKFCEYWSTYAFSTISTVYGNGFELRVDRDVKLYWPDGSYYKTIHSGDKVYTNGNSEAGSTHKDWILIYAHTAGGQQTQSKAYADTGVATISSTNTPVYGNW